MSTSGVHLSSPRTAVKQLKVALNEVPNHDLHVGLESCRRHFIWSRSIYSRSMLGSISHNTWQSLMDWLLSVGAGDLGAARDGDIYR